MKLRTADNLLKKLGVHPLEILKHRYDIKGDKALVHEVADILDVDISPVNEIHGLEDSARKCYVWDVNMTEPQIVNFTDKLNSKFVQKYKHDPKALHLVRNDVNGIEELSPGEVRERVGPWLNDDE